MRHAHFAATTLTETIAVLERYVSEVLQQLYDADDVADSDEEQDAHPL